MCILVIACATYIQVLQCVTDVYTYIHVLQSVADVYMYIPLLQCVSVVGPTDHPKMGGVVLIDAELHCEWEGGMAVCCSVLLYVAACCSMLQYVAALCTAFQLTIQPHSIIHHCVECAAEVCCSVLQMCANSRPPSHNVPLLDCVAAGVCCSTLQCVAVCCSVLQKSYVRHAAFMCVAVCAMCATVAMCCRVL